MNEAAAYINSTLEAHAGLQAAIGGNQFWELADETTPEPFVTYSIVENRAATKDSLGDYDAQVYIWANKLTEAGTISALIKEAVNGTDMRYRGGNTGYTDGEAKAAFLKMDFNFKIRL